MSEAFQPIDPVLDLLGGENVVALRPSFARAFGGVAVGVMLSQFWFYSRMETAVKREGWFYASQEQIEEETGLTRSEQETARRKLRDAGILTEHKAGIPARLYYRLDKGRLAEQLRQWLIKDAEDAKAKAEKKEQAKQDRKEKDAEDSAEAADLFAGFPQTGMQGSRKQARANPAHRIAQMPQTIPKTSLKETKRTLKAAVAAPDISASLFPEKTDDQMQVYKRGTAMVKAALDAAKKGDKQ